VWRPIGRIKACPDQSAAPTPTQGRRGPVTLNDTTETSTTYRPAPRLLPSMRGSPSSSAATAPWHSSPGREHHARCPPSRLPAPPQQPAWRARLIPQTALEEIPTATRETAAVRHPSRARHALQVNLYQCCASRPPSRACAGGPAGSPTASSASASLRTLCRRVSEYDPAPSSHNRRRSQIGPVARAA